MVQGHHGRVPTGKAIVMVAEADARAVRERTIQLAGPTRDVENVQVGISGALVDRDPRGRGIDAALPRAALARTELGYEVVRLNEHANHRGARWLCGRLGVRFAGKISRASRLGRRIVEEDRMVRERPRRAGRRTNR